MKKKLIIVLVVVLLFGLFYYLLDHQSSKREAEAIGLKGQKCIAPSGNTMNCVDLVNEMANVVNFLYQKELERNGQI